MNRVCAAKKLRCPSTCLSPDETASPPSGGIHRFKVGFRFRLVETKCEHAGLGFAIMGLQAVFAGAFVLLFDI